MSNILVFRRVGYVLVAWIGLSLGTPALAQATSRQCEEGGGKDDLPGPACLLSHQSLGKLGVDAVYWNLDKYPSVEAAQRDLAGSGSVVRAFGGIWLFNAMVVRAGPPMLLMAPGPEPRKGFALILHDPSLAPTTLVHHWTPKGLCKAEVR